MFNKIMNKIWWKIAYHGFYQIDWWIQKRFKLPYSWFYLIPEKLSTPPQREEEQR